MQCPTCLVVVVETRIPHLRTGQSRGWPSKGPYFEVAGIRRCPSGLGGIHCIHDSSSGPLLGFPVLYLDVTVSDVTLGPATSLSMLASCISEGMASALKRGMVQLLEPCTNLEVTVPEDHVGRVLADLSSQRRAQIQEVGQGKQGGEKVVTAISPLAGLMVCGIRLAVPPPVDNRGLAYPTLRLGKYIGCLFSTWGGAGQLYQVKVRLLRYNLLRSENSGVH